MEKIGIDKLRIGDIVINPFRNRPDSNLVCIVAWIGDAADKRPYILLVPFTKQGYPSLDRSKCLYISPDVEVVPHKKYPRVKLCPECNGKSVDDMTSLTKYSDLYDVLRRISIYENRYRCRGCQKNYEIED